MDARAQPGGSGRTEVAVVGGGAIGCACALRLAQDGRRVVVVERGEPGGEATWAAGGILGAQMEAGGTGPLLSLSLRSRGLHAELARELREGTGIDVGYRPCGVLELAFDEADEESLAARRRWQVAAGLAAERVDAAFCRAQGASPHALSGLLLAGDGRVDNRLLGRALRLAAEQAGARFIQASAREVLHRGGAVVGVALAEASGGEARLESEQVVIAAGAWSNLLEGTSLRSGVVRPVRGQVIALSLPPPSEMVLGSPQGYAIPRGADRVLVGATREEVGFDKSTTEEGVGQMRRVAERLSPALGRAPLVDRWAGLRPGSADDLPLLGPAAAGPRGLIFATGHFRNGILLAPATAEIVRALVAGRPAPVDLAPFRPDRFAPAR